MRLTEMRNIHYPGLAAFAPVLRVPGVTFVCLQYGTGWQDELRAAGVSMAVVPGLDTTADIEGVVALASQLDAVACPSSTLGWIAAAVGVPNWLLYNTPVFLEFGTDRYPGFPTVRPYRKAQIEPWEPLMQRLAEDLAEWAKG
jgi:ADP-heptose:LPS heptosyltransferase